MGGQARRRNSLFRNFANAPNNTQELFGRRIKIENEISLNYITLLAPYLLPTFLNLAIHNVNETRVTVELVECVSNKQEHDNDNNNYNS